MSQATLRIDALPAGALEASATFHREWLEQAQAILGGDCAALAIIVPAAPYDHADWRRAAVRDLARAWAPRRVNMVAGDDAAAIAETLAFLASAPGVTGQLLQVGGQAGADPAS